MGGGFFVMFFIVITISQRKPNGTWAGSIVYRLIMRTTEPNKALTGQGFSNQAFTGFLNNQIPNWLKWFENKLIWRTIMNNNRYVVYSLKSKAYLALAILVSVN